MLGDVEGATTTLPDPPTWLLLPAPHSLAFPSSCLCSGNLPHVLQPLPHRYPWLPWWDGAQLGVSLCNRMRVLLGRDDPGGSAKEPRNSRKGTARCAQGAIREVCRRLGAGAGGGGKEKNVLGRKIRGRLYAGYRPRAPLKDTHSGEQSPERGRE